MRVELNAVSAQVRVQLVCAKNARDLDELVIVVLAVEEGLFAEDHAGEHAAEGPHIEGVVVVLEVDEELGTFEVAAGNADIVLLLGMVELSKTPVNEAKRAARVVDHDVVRLDIAMHDALRVAVEKSLEELGNIEADVVVRESGVEELEVGVVDILEDKAWGFALGLANEVKQLDDVGPTGEVLQDLDLTLDFFLLHRF